MARINIWHIELKSVSNNITCYCIKYSNTKRALTRTRKIPKLTSRARFGNAWAIRTPRGAMSMLTGANMTRPIIDT